jgi:GTP pyrophosphokinase
MPYSPQFEAALIYALHLHADQNRKNSEIPYITHLMAVASLVAEFGGDEEQVIAALLHDAVEDQGGNPTLEAIRTRFGQRVARLVDGCTDSDVTPKPPWRQRKEDYIERVKTEEEDVLLVSAADKLHNSRTIVADLRQQGPAAFEKFRGGHDGTLWYYRTLLEVYRGRWEHAVLDELEVAVREMHRLADA